MSHHFFAYLSRMKNIKRWGLMRNTLTENIKEHSFDVAVIAQGLAIIKNKYYGAKVDVDKVISVAAYHEVSEIITGDLATPIKYFNPEIKQAFREVEAIATKKVLDMLPEELREEYRPMLICEDEQINQIVKAADKICAYIKCVEELKMGNMEFEKASQKILAALSASKLPEVQHFMRDYISSYSLTLDELN